MGTATRHTTPPSAEDLVELAEQALAAMPEELRVLVQGTAIVVEEAADDETLAEMGLDSPWELTGLYRGIPLTQKSVLDILKQVFQEHGFSDFRVACTGSYAPREYCVQYRETSFAFVSRLMEEEGIFYYFAYEDGKHTLVLADAVSNYADCDPHATAEFRPDLPNAEVVGSWERRYEFVTGKAAHTDYHFITPDTDLLASTDTVVATATRVVVTVTTVAVTAAKVAAMVTTAAATAARVAAMVTTVVAMVTTVVAMAARVAATEVVSITSDPAAQRSTMTRSPVEKPGFVLSWLSTISA